MIYLGIDPSFTKTGLCLLDTVNKKITFSIVSPSGTNENYKAAVLRSSFVSESILEKLESYPLVKVVIEEPLLSSIKASRLGILSGILICSMLANKYIESIYTVKPSYIAWLSRPYAKAKKLNKKNASREIAKQILCYMKTELDYSVEITNDKLNKDGKPKSRVLTHDEAESFLLTITLMRHLKEIPKDMESFLKQLVKNFNVIPKISKI